ncbi:MAG TPA: type IV pilus assembly protein PilM [Solirubrobacterales bacterium]|nr:type IV pilus assembly protein PilM [Solirubrobacterales bacterium]
MDFSSLTKQLSIGRKKSGDLVGLDIEAGSVAAAEVHVNGSAQLKAAAVRPLPPGVFQDGEVADADGLAEALNVLFSENKLSKRVRLGIGNQRVIARTLRLPAIEDPKEMEAAVRFQAQEQIPMPLDQAVLEHQVVGGVPAAPDSPPQVDVVVIAARRDMVATFLDPIRRAGLEPVGVDLAAFGMIRSLAGASGRGAPAETEAPAEEAVLYCNLGSVMNLAVARRRACLFTRVSGIGVEGIVGRMVSEGGLIPEHATQWLVHVGLERPLAEIEGDPQIVSIARRALEEGISGIVDELRLSLDYYGAQESAVPVSEVVLCGLGSAVPGLPARIEEQIGLPIAAVRPGVLAGYDDVAAARLTLPLGLALEG